MTSTPGCPQHHEFEIDYPSKKPIKCIASSSHHDHQLDLFVFTHGANGTLNSEAVLNFRNGFVRISPLTCFQGNMNLASRVKIYNTVLDELEKGKHVTAIGGRSMGARAAVMAAKERDGIRNLVLVAYPLHTDTDVREQILLQIDEGVEVLFISSDGDKLCELQRLEAVREKMKAKSWLAVVENADHGMNVKPKRGTKGVGVLTGEVAARWLLERDEKKTVGRISWCEEEGAEGVALWSGWEEIVDRGNVNEKAAGREAARSGNSSGSKTRNAKRKQTEVSAAKTAVGECRPKRGKK